MYPKPLLTFFLYYFFSIPITSLHQDSLTNTPFHTLSLLFIGDIMGHKTQLDAAYITASSSYQYDEVFQYVKSIITAADFAIANLEVTLAGPPYTGYPSFSSPDTLAVACKNNGIYGLVTAHNHSCDRGKKGIIRTLQTLENLQIAHTGTFFSAEHRVKNNLLILEKNSIKVGLLNYTYGTNGCAIPAPGMVNIIDKGQILADIAASKQKSLDQLIVFLHWGEECQSHPNQEQEKLAHFLLNNGVDIVIGSHPHVLQKMVHHQKKNNTKLVIYSLGNFISNQRKETVGDIRTGGGAMVRIQLKKNNKKQL